MAYATTAQYLLVYDTSASTARLEAYLGRASRKIDAALAANGAAVPEVPGDVPGLVDALMDVCIDMAHRVLGDSGESEMPDGITSYSQSAAGISESFGWPAPYTDIEIRQSELDWLLSLLGAERTGVGAFRFWGDAS